MFKATELQVCVSRLMMPAVRFNINIRFAAFLCTRHNFSDAYFHKYCVSATNRCTYGLPNLLVDYRQWQLANNAVSLQNNMLSLMLQICN